MEGGLQDIKEAFFLQPPKFRIQEKKWDKIWPQSNKAMVY